MLDKFRKWTVLVVIFASASLPCAAQNNSLKPEKQQVKARQKMARRLLKAQEDNTNRSLQRASIPASQRAQVKHQMKRERRELRTRQKQELQDLKDREKVVKEKSGRL